MRRLKRLLNKFKIINSYNYSTLSGVIAFFFIINGGSVIFLTHIFLSYFNMEIDLNLYGINNPILNIFLAPILNESQRIAQSFSLFFILTSLWSASSLFYHIIKTGEILYDTHRVKRSYLRRVFSILLVALFLVLLLTTIVISLISNVILDYINNDTMYRLVQSLLVFTVPLSIIIFFNMFVPPKRLPFIKLYKGIVFTIVFWIIGTIAFLIYINYFNNFKQVYGTLSFIIVFMIWIYFLIQGLIVGMIINHENWLKFQEDKRYLGA